MSRRSLTGCLALSLLAAPLLRAAAPQFWRLEGARDFLEGETDAVSIDSEGRLRLAPASRLLHDPEVPYVWSVAADGKGEVFAGTGNEGKVFRIDHAGKASVFFDAPEMEVHALAVGPDGKLYVGTSPDGQVYSVDPDGHFETFYDPPEKYIWALAFDTKGRLLVGTGADGKVHRVDGKGKGEVLFASPETHVTALACDRSGNVYAGTAPSGVLYRIGADDKVFVLHDSPYREVKSIDVGPDGSVYASLIDGQPRTDAPAAAPSPAPPAAPGTATVEVSEVFTAAFYTGAPAPAPSPAPGAGKPAGAKGAILRVLPTGELDALWASTEETPYGIAVTPEGLLVGTGGKGRLFRVQDDRSWTMVTALPSEEITALARGPKGQVILAVSNPGKVWSLEGAPSAKGTYTSKVKDTDTVSTWGRLTWEGTLSGAEVQVQTRSGNTGSPDTTWSDWSAAYAAAGAPVGSPRARFLQVRATLSPAKGAGPIVDGIRVAYLQQNLRPQIVQFQALPAGEVFQKPLTVNAGELEILGLETGQGDPIRTLQPRSTTPLPSSTAYARKLFQRGLQTFSWKAEDPNGDLLTYDLAYRPVGDTRWTTLRKGVTEAVLAWDTTSVPNGRYLVRLTASDQPNNPEGQALTSEKTSDPFEVDNVPPAVTASLASRSPLTVQAEARDADSPIRRADYSVDAGRWQEIAPVDGINDAPSESYRIVLPDLAPGPHVVVVRAMDMLGNVSAARIEVK